MTEALGGFERRIMPSHHLLGPVFLIFADRLVTVWPAVEHAVMARSAAVTISALGGQSHFQQFSNRCRPGWHAVFVAEIIDEGEFIRSEHDLKTFASKVLHG
jgi:hypothetical protein